MIWMVAMWITVHSADGHLVVVNTHEITAIHSRGTGKNFTENANCKIDLTDGKYVPARETCDEVRELIKREEDDEKHSNSNRLPHAK